MANQTFQGRSVQKHDTKANWEKATNFIPLKGEIIIYDDLKKIKIGDGSTKVNDLDFIGGDDSLSIASKTALGGVKIGNNISIAADGTISVANGSAGARGVVYLVDSYTRTDTDKAVTPHALNQVYNLIPTKTSSLENDSGYLTEHQSLTGLATEAYVEEYVSAHSSTTIIKTWTEA